MCQVGQCFLPSHCSFSSWRFITGLTTFINSTCGNLLMGIRGGIWPKSRAHFLKRHHSAAWDVAWGSAHWLLQHLDIQNFLWIICGFPCYFWKGAFPVADPRRWQRLAVTPGALWFQSYKWLTPSKDGIWIGIITCVYTTEIEKTMKNWSYYFLLLPSLVWTSNCTGCLQESHKCLTEGLLWKGSRGLSSEVAKCSRTCLEQLSYWRCQHKGQEFSLKSLVEKPALTWASTVVLLWNDLFKEWVRCPRPCNSSRKW